MKKRSAFLVAAAAGSLALGGFMLSRGTAQPAPAAAPAAESIDPNKVVITFGNTKITAGEFQTFVNALPPDARALAQTGGRRALAEELVKLKLLSAEAQRRGLENSPMFKQQMAIMRENLLAGVLMFDLQDKLVADQQVRAYYDANKQKLEQVKARHILIPVGKDGGLTDGQAKAKALDIRKRILAGEKFGDLAKAESGDAGTKDDGGELQPFAKGVMVPEFEEAAWTLRPGEISQPVKTEFGYHIIQVDKREVPSFEQAKDALVDKLRQENFEKFYDDLKQKANPQLDPNFFPAPKAPAKPD